MNWDIFWSAFGAIGTTAGTFVTAFAFLLAYRQYKLSKETRLKVKLKCIKHYEGDDIERFLMFDFTNIGLIELFVCNIALNAFGEEYNLTRFIELKRIANNCETEFPIEVTKSQSASVAITYEALYSAIKYIEESNDKRIRYLKFIIKEGNGKEYVKIINKKKL